MKSHHQLVEAAKDAINAVFSDTNVEPDVTRDSLEELREHINENLQALDCDV